MRNTEVIDLIKVLWRWLWLIILIVGATLAVFYIQARFVAPLFTAETILYVSTPDREDVTATDEYTFNNDRDLIATVIDSFTQIAQFSEVKLRTWNTLGINDDYGLTVDSELGSDFITITVYHESAELAQTIANTHAQEALNFYGELRALPSTQALGFFNQEYLEAEQELIDAQNALAEFHLNHNIISLDSEIHIQENVLEGLERNYSELLLPNTDRADTEIVSQSDLQNAENLIQERRNRISELYQIKPEHDALEDRVTDARADLLAMENRIDETQLRQDFASQVMFLQVIQSADLPNNPIDNSSRTLVFAAFASFGVAVFLVFFLDYLRTSW